MAGALTHIAWDAFTHDDRWGVRQVEWLQTAHGPLPGYAWAQYASGLLGLGVLVIAISRWWARTPPMADGTPLLPTPLVAGAWGMLLLAAGIGGLAGALAAPASAFSSVGYYVATWGGAAALLAATVIAAGLAGRRTAASRTR